MKRFIKTVPDGDYYLLAVAVDDQARGSGIGSTLLDYSEATARAHGCARIVSMSQGTTLVPVNCTSAVG